ncbi:MAG: hypothetical protein F4X02_14965 [Chloroflexi bacterium]|nr:hypothetical protein [Chloroflexota bacterium]
MDVMQQAEDIIEAASEESEFQYQGPVPPERIAWIVMLGAFLLFCTVTLTTIFGVYHYLFRSTVPMAAVLQVSKGTVGITGPDLVVAAERERDDLTSSVTSVSTDSLSQATIQIKDLDEGEFETAELLAAVTLQGNTLVTFNHANRPRFEWGRIPQRIQFSRLDGMLDILIAGVSNRTPFLMDFYSDSLSSDKGVHVQFESNGRFRLSVSEDEVRLLSLAGEAVVYFRDEPSRRESAKSGNELVVRIGARSMTQLQSQPNVLKNGEFSLLQDSGATRALNDWRCSIRQQQAPPGDFSLARFDGRVALRLRRLNNAQSNGEVRCTQTFAGAGLDVQGYDTVRVVTTFLPNYQNLSVCGRAASECPLMLQVNYEYVDEDERRQDAEWYRGFYYAPDISGVVRKRCDTCIQDHLDINPAVWHTFDSDNLFNLIVEEERPATIKSLSFYASGHQFDTLISEMALLLSNSAAG